MEKHGDTRVPNIDFNRKPWYIFGNTKSEQRYGQVSMGVQANDKSGTIDIIALLKEEIRIWVSKRVLAKMGAIIDLEHGFAVFVYLDPSVAVKLEGSPDGGHYYMSFVQDLLSQQVSSRECLANLERMAEQLLLVIKKTSKCTA